MKNLFLLINILLFFLYGQNTFGQQTTWVKTLKYESGPSYPGSSDTLNLGPTKIITLPNGSLFVLNHQIDYDQYLYIVNNSGQILFSDLVGYNGLSQSYYAFGLAKAPGNSVAYIERFLPFAAYPEFKLFKITTAGTSILIHQWIPVPGALSFDQVNSVLPNYHNGYYCNVNDTFIDIPSNIIIPGHLIYVFANDDYLSDDLDLQRKDVAGTSIWNFPLNNYQVVATSETSIYLTYDSLKKVDATSGQLLWTKPLPGSGIFDIMKSTDGLVVLDERLISVLDSSGIISDTNSILLSVVPPTAIASANNGAIYTGGEFINITSQIYRNYSTFLIKLNENAEGVIDSTTFFLAGDADNNSDVSFVKDGLFIAAAIGHTTPLSQLNSNEGLINTTYAEQWPDSSDCGINYKYSDAIMNGIIEKNDVEFLKHSWAFFTPSTNDSASSIVKIILENNILSPGDTAYATIIIGSQGLPTDSFYGISFEALLPTGILFSPPYIVEIKNNVMGDTTSNLLYIESPYINLNYYLGMILCRTDHQNISLAGDTILRVKALVSPNILPGVYPVNNSCFMINEGGCFLPVNIISDSLQIISNSTKELTTNLNIKVYPNPASNKINISSGENSKKEILIKNILGKTVYTSTSSEEHFSIQTENWSSGVYFLEITSGKFKRQYKFIVEGK